MDDIRPMTMDRLNEIRKACQTYRGLRIERNALYNTYYSPKMNGTYQKHKTVSDPVVAALNSIDSIDRKLNDLYLQILTFRRDLWAQVDDYEIILIIEVYYILCRSWRETEKTIYKCKRGHPREKLLHYLETINQKG